MRRFGVGLSLLLVGMASAHAAPGVDVALVLAVDVSLSVDADRYHLQQEGIAAAFESPEVAAAIAAGPEGAVGVAVLEFSDPDRQFPVIAWTRVASSADAHTLAERVRRTRRSSKGLTGMADGLLGARALFRDLPWQARRRIIDVSGDGMNNIGGDMIEARDAVLASGITINGLPILTDEPWIESYYQEDVIGGPDSFLIVAKGPEDFAEAMRRKLSRELGIS